MRDPVRRCVIYDWDGTLVDSAPASFRCYRGLFPRYGIEFDEEVFARTYSPDWYRTYAALGLPREHWDDADRLWVELYARETTELMPGARDGLARLHELGVVQGLVTSGDRSRVLRELERLDVAESFAAVLCGGDTRNKKPHPEALLLALERLDQRSGEAVYVGDSPEDVEMARAAGVFSVGVRGGFPNGEAMRRSSPDLLAGSLEEAYQKLGYAP